MILSTRMSNSSRALDLPPVLEYNDSEVWIAQTGDSTRFSRRLRLGEELALASAALRVVVSEPLHQELAGRGRAEERILVNPNAVDVEVFRSGHRLLE